MPVQTLEHTSQTLPLTDKTYTLLRYEIEETFGRSVTTSRDCILICEEIFIKTGYKLNSNTLRRFFGLVKAQYPCSAATLNILARYCGYQTVNEISASQFKVYDQTLQDEDWSILYYFINLFKNAPVKKLDDETFLMFVSHTISFLQKKPEIIEKFQRGIVKTVNGQLFYFEQFINFDRLSSFYGNGLRYYINEKKTPEGKLFGYALLCIRDWLIDDSASLKKNYEYLREQRLPKDAQPLIYGNFFIAQLLYTDVFEQSSEQVIVEAYKVHAGIRSAETRCNLFNSFEFHFSIFLLLTHHYEEALYYACYALENCVDTTHHLYSGCYQKLMLIKALALSRMHTDAIHKQEVQSQAEKIFQLLKPSEFYFLSKRMDMILYLLLGNYVSKSSYKQQKQFMELIKETGFKKLEYLWGKKNENE